MQAFDYYFNLWGNFPDQIDRMGNGVDGFNTKIQKSTGWVENFAKTCTVFDLLANYVDKVGKAFGDMAAPGIRLNSQMHDLSAVAGVTGDALKEIEGYARDSAKAFGTDAGTAVEGYKLLLSQLTPELGKCPVALKSMGESIQTTSKLMGGDGVAAAEVLTTAMNQFGVSMDDPIAASKTMADMMNTMAAAGQAGSAELPAIKAALQQAGMAAKAANVSFEETNAAIQVLDKAGKKGSEGGVALRNTLAILSQGRFLPKDTQKELQGAGIDVLALGDKNKTLKERLEMLKPILSDSALLTKLFGMENANAARALVGGTDKLQEFTDAVTGTSSAEEQAAIVMDSYAERQARIRQQIDDAKISIFQATGDAALWVGALADTLVPMAQMVPLISGVGSLMAWTKGLDWAGMWRGTTRVVTACRYQMLFMNNELKTGIFTSNGFAINMLRATLAVVRFGTVGLMQGLKALGAFLLSLATTGGASATFAATASTAFGAFKLSAVTACRAVSVAIINIPIIGWIAAIIAGLAALGIYFWNTSVKFRAVLKGLAAAFVATFKGVWDMAKMLFGSIGDLISAAFRLDASAIAATLLRMRSGFSQYGSSIGKAFSDAYNAEMAKGAKKKEDKPSTPRMDVPAIEPVDVSGGTLQGTGTGTGTGDKESGPGKIRNITINIERLVDKFEVHTSQMAEGAERIREAVATALMGALNDVQLAQ